MATVSVAAPSDSSRDYQQRLYVFKSSPLEDTADRLHSRHHRPATYTKRHYKNGTDREDNSDEDRSRYHRHRRSTRDEDRYPDHYMGSSTSNVQDMTSWLDRLALAEDDDDAISSAHSQRKGDDSHVSQRQKTYTYGRYNYRDHDDKPTASYSGSYAKREASVRSHSPVSSHSRSPSRSPSPRRRAVVSTHNSLRGRDRDTSRDRSVYDTYDRHSRRDRYDGHDRRDSHSDAHSRKSLPPCRSVPDRSDSHSRRRPPLKRGPSSSSSTSNNSSSSKSAWESAARNALRAGTMAALSSHSAPGSWFGNKGTRVATAALGAALVDTYMGHRHPESVNGVRHTAMRQAAEYAISSIVAEPIMQRAARRKTRR